MTDEELIWLFFARSEEAVEALQAQYGAYCRAVARQFLTDARDVEECLSDRALTVWDAIPPTRPELSYLKATFFCHISQFFPFLLTRNRALC